MAFITGGASVPDYIPPTSPITVNLQADHRHLVEYLSDSLQYAPHPMPLGEKCDTVYNGVKISMRVYMEITCPYFALITDGADTRLTYGGFEKGYFEKILAAYNPDATGSDNIYHCGR